MQTLAADLKHAFRILRQSPGFTAAAISALALGIGANTAIFSVVNTVLLRPLSFPQPDRIVVLMNSSPQGSGPGASVPKFNIWRRQTNVLEDISAFDTGGPGLNIGGGERPEQVKGIHVSKDFFHLFGAQTVLGRTFTAEEDLPRGPRVIVLSNGLWQRRFGADPAVVGKGLVIGGEVYSIIGVLAPNFTFDPAPDLYLPFQADPNSTNQGHYFRVAARLKPGVSLTAAQASLQLAGEEFKRTYPGALDPRSTLAWSRCSDCSSATSVPRSMFCWARLRACCSLHARMWPVCCWRVRHDARGKSRSAHLSGPAAAVSSASSSRKACCSP
jgi:hypothetical protein